MLYDGSNNTHLMRLLLATDERIYLLNTWHVIDEEKMATTLYIRLYLAMELASEQSSFGISAIKASWMKYKMDHLILY